jgi:hypothetical protein
MLKEVKQLLDTLLDNFPKGSQYLLHSLIIPHCTIQLIVDCGCVISDQEVARFAFSQVGPSSENRFLAPNNFANLHFPVNDNARTERFKLCRYSVCRN